jgi:hypothetical protein
MAEYPITVPEIVGEACYQTTVQELINYLADAITVQITGNPIPYIVSATTPSSENNNSAFFQTKEPVGTSQYGSPKAVRIYADSKWQEFSQFKQGDMILVADNSVVISPWGEYPYTYTFLSGTNLSTYSPPVTPEPPQGFKYKRYVGAWTSKA